ncbi:MAG: hypothetical protein R3D84_09590 [Paracoccaceae bacterium]
MGWLVWIGAFVALGGVGALVWCATSALKLRAAGLDDAELRGRLQRLVVVNMGALAVAAIGLIMVVFGLFLG